ncbi:MAG TPA: cyclic pyranopterin monophosphate synthase MoaC [Candidatus Binatia bacterium]|nr:cyclic pyranopterin monophosphate synthase MoaC [Candidatus Binatia bacterium]
MTLRRTGKATAPARRLSHVDARGQVQMVDVGAKPVTERIAVARATVRMRPETLRLITSRRVAKGDALAAARVAGIMAAKRTAELIPLCHPLPVEVVGIDFAPRGAAALEITARVKMSGKTGVEMEALTAVSIAALTIYDMCKAVDRGLTITDVQLIEKSGGRSGMYRRES